MIIEDNQFDKEKDYIFQMIENENQHQLEKWGIQKKHVFEWVAWTAEEFGELIKGLNELNYERTSDFDSVITEGIQTMTLLTKIISGLIHIAEKEAENNE